MSIFLTPKCLLKTQISEKKVNLSNGKYQLTSFSRTKEYEKPQATIHKGPQGLVTVTAEVITSLF